MIARCTMTCFIPGAFIFFKFFIAKLPNFEFLLYWTILFGFYGFKESFPSSLLFLVLISV